jgi:RND superfamily putative drug exporter
VLVALARFTIRRRRWLVAAWVVLTLLGGVAAGKLSDRWFQSFSIPGFSAYEANQRTLKTFGSGEQAPLVAVFTTPGKDVTTVPGIERSIQAGVEQIKGRARVGSWFETHSDAYVSKAGQRDVLDAAADRRGTRGAQAHRAGRRGSAPHRS